MNKIVGIGANVYDTLVTLPTYPTEDTKMRADGIVTCGGGPVGTGLVAASKLGVKSAYIGALADDDGGKFLLADMERYGMSTDLVTIDKSASSFSSYIWLGRENATRTCVFYKDNLPKCEIDEKKARAIEEAEILMVDGNDLENAIRGAKIANACGTKVLYDAGGLYEGIERLLPLADILIPSEEFSLAHTKTDNVEDAAKRLYEMYSPEVVVITRGKHGGVMYDGKELRSYPIIDVKVVDSNGSGDVFHGAYAVAMVKGYDYYKACIFSSAVSSLKCTKLGARSGVPSFEETIQLLKENGYEF